ncbi:hypothetical protein EWM64_g8191, partial [Hericium alpestre]
QKIPKAWRELYALEKGKVMDKIDDLYNSMLRVEYAGKIGMRPREDADYDEMWSEYVDELIETLQKAWAEEKYRGKRPVVGLTKLEMRKIRQGIAPKLMLFLHPWPVLEDGEKVYRWDNDFLMPIPMMTLNLRDLAHERAWVLVNRDHCDNPPACHHRVACPLVLSPEIHEDEELRAMPDLHDACVHASCMVQCIHTENFKSAKGNKAFWRQHCFAVPRFSFTEEGSKKHQPQMCRHCGIVKYGGGTHGASNHWRSCCSDGAPLHTDSKVLDKPLPWPQLEGIFVDAKEFHVMEFLAAVMEFLVAVKTFYKVVILWQEPVCTLEYKSFGTFIKRRMFVVEGMVLFPLYMNLKTVPTHANLPSDFIMEYQGKDCLWVKMLSDEDVIRPNSLMLCSV